MSGNSRNNGRNQMSELRDAARRLLEVLGRDHSLGEKQDAFETLAAAVDPPAEEPKPKAAPKYKKAAPSVPKAVESKTDVKA